MAIEPAAHDDTLYLGIDGGGTKCCARIVNAKGDVLGSGTGGPSNPLHGVERTLESIVNATTEALSNANLSPEKISELVAGVGLAGVNLPSLFDVIARWDHPFQKMYLTTDLHIACLGAHQQDEGAVMVAGTGSCGYAFVNNKATILGAHGFPYGDQASGAWMGLEAIKAVLLASDGLGPDTKVRAAIETFLNAKGVMIVDKMVGARQSDYARLALFVLDAADEGDEIATRIVKEGAEYLNDMASKLWATGVNRMSFIGGVSHRLLPWMDQSIVSRLSPALSQPEFGAIYFAKQQFNK